MLTPREQLFVGYHQLDKLVTHFGVVGLRADLDALLADARTVAEDDVTGLTGLHTRLSQLAQRVTAATRPR